MKNRNLFSPILSAVVLSLVFNSPLLSEADTAVSNLPTTTPGTPVPPASTTVGTSPAPTVKHTTTYTVVKGDSLTSIAQKFNTTRKKLKALNNLTASSVKPGQVLLVPFYQKSAKSTATATAKTKAHHAYPVAQPVQDFDIPASTFASCPVPVPSEDEDADSSTTTATDKPAPIAKLVSPAELAAAEAEQNAAQTTTASAPTPMPAGEGEDVVVTPNDSPTPVVKPAPSYSSNTASTFHTYPVPTPVRSNPAPPLTYNAPAPKPPHRTLAQILGFGPSNPTPANDWGSRFLTQARALGNEGIEYDEDWRPPGESRSWTMDCSNTTRYLYKVTTGIQLPRTASDQYYYLHLQGKAWDVPQNSYGLPDTEYLRQNLKVGDLLFWENTYRPERQPPITHVMVFLGTNEKGEWIMAGSQTSRGGEHNRRNGGPDIYVFRPSQPCGGYTTWMGLVHHTGRFCAFGRPLEADPTKLAMAENN